jgi:hypothetical protein
LLESPVTVALSVADLPSARDASEVVKLTMITLEALIVATAVEWVTPSFAEVAVIVTVPSEGTVDEAVYVVAPPLAVFVGLKLPQPGDDPQLHVTPAPSTSFVTCALRVSVPDVVTLNVEGDTVTIMGRIVIVALADLVESATEVAVMVTVPHEVIVTVPHEGTVIGAVYVVPTVLCVCVGLKDPHELEPQVAVQLTPSVLTSLVMVAVTGVVPPTASDVGVVDSVTMMAGSTIVIVTLDCCEGSLVTRAVKVTVMFAGITPGAV